MSSSQTQAQLTQDHIIKTLNFFIRDYFMKTQGDYIKALSPALAKMKGIKNGKWSITIPHLEIPICGKEFAKHDPRFLIGGIIEAKEGKIVYSTFSISIIFTTKTSEESSDNGSLNIPSCCLNENIEKRRIVRHFHFDFQPKSNKEPISHFQYGGKFPEDEQFKDYHYCLEHKLKIPRIFFPPMDLVLVFDLIIREFNTPLEKWIDDPSWKKLVFQSQKLWWEEYWKESIKHLRNKLEKTFLENIYGRSNES